MYSSLRNLTLAGLCMLASVAQSATPPDPAAASLTLDAALRRVMDYNYAIQAAERRVGIRAGEAEHAGRFFPSNPELEVESAQREAPDGTSTTDLGITLKQEIWMGNKGDLRE
ncbi:MAG: hypothetical protein SVX28_12455, partial [Pseudomonadota bacterium]|nr:hypothetical protein [Pseudomonadota bacterium]